MLCYSSNHSFIHSLFRRILILCSLTHSLIKSHLSLFASFNRFSHSQSQSQSSYSYLTLQSPPPSDTAWVEHKFCLPRRRRGWLLLEYGVHGECFYVWCSYFSLISFFFHLVQIEIMIIITYTYIFSNCIVFFFSFIKFSFVIILHAF